MGRLAEQQRGQHRFADRRDHPVGELLGERELGGGELHRLFVAAEFDQRDDGVQPVGRLVRLRPEGFGEASHRVQLSAERLEFGVVAQGDDPAEAGTDGGGVEHHHPFGGQVHLVPHRLVAEHGRDQRPR